MQIITDRRALHRIPEIELMLPKTMDYLRSALSGLNCRLFSPIEYSLCAYFDFGKEQTLAFRADCDALPVQEKSDVPHASTHPGCMHACGHDGHMAIALELARRVNTKKDLPHNILIIFQPGEETPGGAKPICDTGVLEAYKVKALFGLHIWPGLEKGKVFSREKELMSRSSEINVDIYGKSAHIGRASEGIDALAAGVEFYRRAVAMEQALPKEIYRLLKFGHMESGTVRNALSAHTHLEGSLRAFQDEVFDELRTGLDKIAADIAAETGCTVTVTGSEGYRAVLNPPELFRKVMAIAPFARLAEPSMTSEDFSFYQRRVPAIFFFLGLGDTPALHANTFNFDEQILVKGADFFEKLAEEFL